MAAESYKQLLLEPLSCSDSEGSEDLEWSCRDKDELDSAERDERRRAGKRLMVALVISLVFMVAEVLGGYASHSLAIMTDAAHLLSDVGSISLSIFSLWISGRTPTRTFTFGWRRAEIVGMLVSLSSIWAVTAVLVWSAARRISDGDYDIDTDIMLLTSGCGVAVNILMVLILQQSGVSHTHNHGWPQKDEERRGLSHGHGNASVKAACVHAVGDLIQSVGVLLAAAVIHFWPECKVADPICTLLFSLVVMWTTFPTARDVFRVLMDGAPPGISVASVHDALLAVRGVSSLHRLHVWSLDMTHTLLCVHITAEDGADPHVIVKRATKLLSSDFCFTSITIQVEPSATLQLDIF